MADTITLPCDLPNACLSDEECHDRVVRLITINRSALLAFLRRMRLQPEDAEDILQETCIRVLSCRARWRGEKSACGFIYTVAANLARDELRRRRRFNRREHIPFDDSDLVCGEPAPSQEAEMAHMVGKLFSALRRLTPRCQQIVDMHFAQQMSFQRIAAQLGVSKKTVERDITLARDYCGVVMQGRPFVA